jgi:hypothetical protein
MRRIVMAVALALACGEDCPDSIREQVAPLYRLDGAEVQCVDALDRTEDAEKILCGWECVAVNGRTARRLVLDFRPDVTAPWRLSMVSVEWIVAGECH